jgi:hypothetical protein
MIDGFSISGYRSFGPDEVRIDGLSRINVFIGKNNCGKSNILKFVKRVGALMREQAVPDLDPNLDFCQGAGTRRIVVGVQLKPGRFTGATYDLFVEGFAEIDPAPPTTLPDELWLHFDVSGKIWPDDRSIRGMIVRRLGQQIPPQTLTEMASGLYARGRPSWDVHLIEAFRKISDSGEDPLSGAGLIKRLREIQSPELLQREASKERFGKIVGFLRSVLGEPDATMEIPASKDEIYVEIGSKMLPLHNLGTGIHELIILAAAVTLVDNAVFCIEEPEIHFHPELQKKFVRYIAENTSNQYLIASHSNAFLDLQDVNIYRCWLDGAYTKCELASEASDKHEILRDLGYRPSDLLQANYVIWVEGPSDRVYVNHWIKAKSPEFVEGLHYAIMFYGGRLLSHLSYEASASDGNSDVIEFIRLSRLNRNACVVIDSDRAEGDQALNHSKQRIAEEFKQHSCFVWVTSGRTIENYVPEAALNQAIAAVHPKSSAVELTWARYADLTHVRPEKVMDKVAVARRVTEGGADFSNLDLNAKMTELVELIRSHNS